MGTLGVAAVGPGSSARWRNFLTQNFDRRVANIVFWSAAISSVVWISLLEQGFTFFYDDWDFVLTKQIGYWQFVWNPHGGHPSMLPYTVYWILFHIAGIAHYWPYLAVQTALNVVCGYLVFTLARQRVPAIMAAAAASVLMLLGPAWQDLLWAFQIGFLGSTAAGLAALVLLAKRRTRSDLGACVALLIAVGCSAVSVPILLGVTVMLLWEWAWRRLWVPIVPGIAFAVWYELKDKGTYESGLHSQGVAHSLHYVAVAMSETFAALTGRGTVVGTVVGCAIALVTISAVIFGGRSAARLLMVLVTVGVFWGLTASARGATLPVASRYLYPAAAFTLVGIAEAVGIVFTRLRASNRPLLVTRVAARLHGPGGIGIAGSIATLALATVIICWNTTPFTAGADFLIGWDAHTQAVVTGTEIGITALPFGYRPNTLYVPQIYVGPLYVAIAAYGSPGIPLNVLLKEPTTLRLLADQTILGGAPIQVRPVPRSTESCTSPTTLSGSSAALALPTQGLTVYAGGSTPMGVRARFLSNVFGNPIGGILPGETAHIQWSGAAKAKIPWTIQLSVKGNGSLAGTVVCSAEAS